MNGRDLTLGLVGALAVGAALGKRGSRGVQKESVPDLKLIKEEARSLAATFRRAVKEWDDWNDPDMNEDFEMGWHEDELYELFPHLLGMGNYRVVMPSRVDPRIVIKLDIRGGGSSGNGNLDEAGFWKDAGPETRKILVPVLAHDPKGAWLLMERVTPMEESEGSHTHPILLRAKQRAREVGLIDIREENISTDGRILDYAEPVTSLGSAAIQPVLRSYR